MVDSQRHEQFEDRVGGVVEFESHSDSSTERSRERREIAALLHDSVGQLLPLANVKLAALRANADDALCERITEIQEILAEAHATTSSLTARLSPPAIHDIGLAAALQVLAREIFQRHDLKVDVEIDRGPFPLEESMEHALYRVVRELLVNAAKHAGVAEAHVWLGASGTELRVVIEDCGVGFEPGASDSWGLGLRSARDRLDPLGARMDIDSRPGAGTRVLLRAPLADEKAAERGDGP